MTISPALPALLPASASLVLTEAQKNRAVNLGNDVWRLKLSYSDSQDAISQAFFALSEKPSFQTFREAVMSQVRKRERDNISSPVFFNR